MLVLRLAKGFYKAERLLVAKIPIFLKGTPKGCETELIEKLLNTICLKNKSEKRSAFDRLLVQPYRVPSKI